MKRPPTKARNLSGADITSVSLDMNLHNIPNKTIDREKVETKTIFTFYRHHTAMTRTHISRSQCTY